MSLSAGLGKPLCSQGDLGDFCEMDPNGWLELFPTQSYSYVISQSISRIILQNQGKFWSQEFAPHLLCTPVIKDEEFHVNNIHLLSSPQAAAGCVRVQGIFTRCTLGPLILFALILCFSFLATVCNNTCMECLSHLHALLSNGVSSSRFD